MDKIYFRNGEKVWHIAIILQNTATRYVRLFWRGKAAVFKTWNTMIFYWNFVIFLPKFLNIVWKTGNQIASNVNFLLQSPIELMWLTRIVQR